VDRSARLSSLTEIAAEQFVERAMQPNVVSLVLFGSHQKSLGMSPCFTPLRNQDFPSSVYPASSSALSQACHIGK
jgi:hypothetical protein